jgi:hypothetical protein
MRAKSRMAGAVVVVTLVGAGIAQLPAASVAKSYAVKPGKKCKRGYYRRSKRHHKILCVKKKAPTPAAAGTLRPLSLQAHVDRTPSRDPLDPFKVTYGYGAGAAVSNGQTTEAIAPPAGVSALYVDGSLECAMNVGGGNPSQGECAIPHETLGPHRVTTIYSTGSASATDTAMIQVDPLPTTTSLKLTYDPLGMTQNDFGCGDNSECLQESGWIENGGFDIGTVRVEARSSRDPVPVSACPGGDPNCATLPLDGEGLAILPVSVIANYISLEEKKLAIGDTLNIEPEAVKAVTLHGTTIHQALASQIEDGQLYFRVESKPRAGYAGSSASSPIQFSPIVTSPVERIACGC